MISLHFRTSKNLSISCHAIQYLVAKVMLKDVDPFCIEVRRVHVVKDAMKEAGKGKFQPNKPMKVSKSCMETQYYLVCTVYLKGEICPRGCN